MKNYYCLLICCLIGLSSWSQETIVPKENLVDKKWVRNQSYKMAWSMLRDTLRMPIGTVTTDIKVLKDQILVTTAVKMNSSAAPWIDSTIVNRKDFSPVYHSSYNLQRNMVINFGKEIKGFYRDKTTGKNTDISQEVNQRYFDSNFYPVVINWLPLKKSLKVDLDIYDYNPKGKMGMIKAHILNVTEGKYVSKKLGERKVWIVEVNDEIGSGADGRVFYSIDQLTRQLYLQRISAGGRVMEMTLVEDN